MAASSDTTSNESTKIDLADLIDSALQSDHAKSIAAHPDFSKIAASGILDDLTKKLQNVLGKSTGVKQGMEIDSKVEKGMQETPAQVAAPANVSPVDMADWEAALKDAKWLYSGDSSEELKQRAEYAQKAYEVRRAASQR